MIWEIRMLWSLFHVLHKHPAALFLSLKQNPHLFPEARKWPLASLVHAAIYFHTYWLNGWMVIRCFRALHNSRAHANGNTLIAHKLHEPWYRCHDLFTYCARIIHNLVEYFRKGFRLAERPFNAFQSTFCSQNIRYYDSIAKR